MNIKIQSSFKPEEYKDISLQQGVFYIKRFLLFAKGYKDVTETSIIYRDTKECAVCHVTSTKDDIKNVLALINDDDFEVYIYG